MTVIFHPEADLEFNHELLYYGKISEPLSIQFFESVDAAIIGIQKYPKVSHNRGGGIYSVRIKNFPFSIYYRVVSSHNIRILSVFNDSRNPAIWKNRHF